MVGRTLDVKRPWSAHGGPSKFHFRRPQNLKERKTVKSAVNQVHQEVTCLSCGPTAVD